MEVSDLTPQESYIALDPSVKQSVELRAQFSPASFQRLLEVAGDTRRLQIQLYFSHYVPLQAPTQSATVSRSELGGLFQTWTSYVGGKVDGNPNIQQFKVDAEEWARAVEQTRAAQYVVDTLLVMNTEREYVKELLADVREAEKLLLAGQVKEAIGRVRGVCEWLGYKPQGEQDRYSKLRGFDFSDSEREEFRKLLDALWGWSSKGHHRTPSSDEYTEEQAWMSIHMGYLILSYLSRKQIVQPE